MPSGPDRPLRGAFLPTLTAVGLVGVAVRCGYAILIGRHLHFGPDSIWYQLVGGQLAAGYGYVDPSALIATGRRVATANFPPGYPVVVALAHGVGLGSTFDLQFVGAAIGGVTVFLTGLLGRRVGGFRVGLLAALLAACWPPLIAMDGSVMSETVAVPVALGALLGVMNAQDRGGGWRWALAGVALGLAVLTRSELPLLGGCLFVIVVLTGGAGRRTRLANASLMIAVMVIVVLPWTADRISAVGAQAALSTNGAKTLAGANCDETYFGGDLGGWRFGCVTAATGGAPAEKVQASRARQTSERYVKQHVTRLPLVLVARELRLFGVWSPAKLDADEVIESRNARWQRLGWWASVVMLPFAAAGGVLLWRRRPVVLAPVLTAVLTAALTWGNQRLRLVAEPVLLVAVTLGATTLLAAWATRRRPQNRRQSAPS